MRTTTSVFALAAVVAAAMAGSQNEPATPGEAWTVNRVLTEARDDEKVMVTGKVTRLLGDEDFMLADDTGEIRVDVDDDDPSARQVQVGATVEVHGEADRDSDDDTEIEADRVITTAQT